MGAVLEGERNNKFRKRLPNIVYFVYIKLS